MEENVSRSEFVRKLTNKILYDLKVGLQNDKDFLHSTECHLSLNLRLANFALNVFGDKEESTMIRYNVGDIILQQSWTSGQRLIRITNKSSDIKNGEAGFDGIVCDKDGKEVDTKPSSWNKVWGYDDQIIKVVKKSG